MTSEGLGEMFEGDSADMCAGKFPLVSMGGRADTSSARRRGARTPISVSKFFKNILLKQNLLNKENKIQETFKAFLIILKVLVMVIAQVGKVASGVLVFQIDYRHYYFHALDVFSIIDVTVVMIVEGKLLTVTGL